MSLTNLAQNFTDNIISESISNTKIELSKKDDIEFINNIWTAFTNMDISFPDVCSKDDLMERFIADKKLFLDRVYDYLLSQGCVSDATAIPLDDISKYIEIPFLMQLYFVQ